MKNLSSSQFEIQMENISRPAKVDKLVRSFLAPICKEVGLENQIRVSVNLISSRRKLYELKIVTETIGQALVFHKEGRSLPSLLRKGKKAIIKKTREVHLKDLEKMRGVSLRKISLRELWNAS